MSRTAYINEYKKKHFKRITLEIPLEEYPVLKAEAEKRHESVNGFIKKAIQQRIENET